MSPPPVVPPSSRTRMFLSWLGGFDHHDGDAGAADDTARAQTVTADQIRRGTPERDIAGFPFTPDEMHSTDYDALIAAAVAMSDVHVVLTTGNLAPPGRLYCGWVDRAMVHAFGAQVPQLCVDVHGLPGTTGNQASPGSNVFETSEEIFWGKAERVDYHDYVTGNGARDLGLWVNHALTSPTSVELPRPGRRLGVPNTPWSARKIQVLVSAAGNYDSYIRPGVTPDSDDLRWERIRKHHVERAGALLPYGSAVDLRTLHSQVFRTGSDELCDRVIDDSVRRADLHLVLVSEYTADSPRVASAVGAAERWGVPQLGLSVHRNPAERRSSPLFAGEGVPVVDYIGEDGDANLPAWIERAVAAGPGGLADADDVLGRSTTPEAPPEDRVPTPPVVPQENRRQRRARGDRGPRTR